jgi:hypothetical protein
MKMVAGQEGKRDVVYADIAAAAVTVAADECALWVGATVEDSERQQQVFSSVMDCLERIREVGTPRPPANEYLEAVCDWIVEVPRKPDIKVELGTAFSAPSEDEITIVMGDGFQPHDNSSITTAVKRMLEVWMERDGKKI